MSIKGKSQESDRVWNFHMNFDFLTHFFKTMLNLISNINLPVFLFLYLPYVCKVLSVCKYPLCHTMDIIVYVVCMFCFEG